MREFHGLEGSLKQPQVVGLPDIGTDVNESACPAWLDLPDEQIEPKRVELWTCFGTDIPQLKRKWWQRSRPVDADLLDTWLCLYPTKEEAEADSSRPSDIWDWDGNPARPFSLEDSLRKCRERRKAGVCIQAYRNGEWVTVREFPASVPYFGDSE